ncbi:hypothetical protein M758_3G226400 [Ceratodon purpureus]|nr:hypothetical protein M758_3G226400 [Ceratodon purpureus]
MDTVVGYELQGSTEGKPIRRTNLEAGFSCNRRFSDKRARDSQTIARGCDVFTTSWASDLWRPCGGGRKDSQVGPRARRACTQTKGQEAWSRHFPDKRAPFFNYIVMAQTDMILRKTSPRILWTGIRPKKNLWKSNLKLTQQGWTWWR